MVKKEIRQGVLWKGSLYLRKNRGKGKPTWRDSNNPNTIFNSRGDPIGVEPVRKHVSGRDVKKIRKGQKIRRRF